MGTIGDTIKRSVALTLAAGTLALLAAPQVRAADVLDVKVVGTDLARDIVDKTVKKCADDGYAASAVVVDRNGDIMAALRGDVASRFTLDIAAAKARAVILSGTSSGELLASRNDIRQELNHLDGILVMRGGLAIESGGMRIGAVGVSGAPTGEIDEGCAKFALDELFERLGF